MTRRASARSARLASSDEAAGHFAWEQAAHAYGGLVADWVSGGYGRVSDSSLFQRSERRALIGRYMNGISSAGMTTKGRIMSWSSCSRMWQWYM